jgi:predicted metal-dependent HD superfamily phosphohydrolase
MTEKDFESLQEIVLAELDGLSPHLTYHSKQHTIDVLTQSLRIAASEGIVDPYELLLLKFAALFHDIGFLQTYANHEAKGCELFLQFADSKAFSDAEKDGIQSLIMATKLPQSPKNHLEKVICDADLDYLGRDDFFTIGDNLRKEFLHYNIVPSNEAWEKLQLNFLKNHQYFTESSRTLREPVKQLHYSKLL